MKKYFVGGNWKMNGTKSFVDSFAKEITSKKIPANVEAVIFPPFVYIDEVAKKLKGSDIFWGGQNMAADRDGPFTGEISGNMLTDLGCQYVIVGHSERRGLYSENNTFIAKKFFQAFENDLIPVLCVGETKQQRINQETELLIKKQIQAVLNECENLGIFKKFIVAYEPVWAIGTGISATPEEAQTVHHFIREIIEKYDKSLAQTLPIIYGGSVTASNAASFLKMPDINGFLVGGASLKANEFLEIIEICSKSLTE